MMRATMTETLEIAIKAVQLYAESHPRPSQVTQTQAAEMLGMSRNTVAKLVRAGNLRLNGCGLIPVSEIDKILATDSPKNSPRRAVGQW